MTDSGASPSASPSQQPAFAGGHPGAIVAAQKPPGPISLAWNDFWGERRRVVPNATLVACAAVGVAGGGLVVGHRLGLGAAVVGALMWAAAVPTLVRRRAVGDLVTAVLSVALVAVVAVRDAGWVVALCLAAAAGTGAVAATSARSAPAVLLSIGTWTAGVARAVPWVGTGVGRAAGSRRSQLLVALRSLVVTFGLLLVFGLLFASADTVFASYLPRFDPGLLHAQVVVGALVALAAATLAHLAMAPPAWSTLGLKRARTARRGEWLLPVLALGALVLAFVLVQVGALLGGHRHVLATAGLTYAEYTRQGFAQLVVVTALTLVVVGVAARWAPRATERDRLLSRAALGLLCLGTLGVVASALRRMDLYVDAFGLTRLRLFVVVVELVLAAVFVLVMVAGVRWRGGWLPRAVVQVVAVGVLALAAVNPDAQIVRHNTTADLDASSLDVFYLQGLSDDAVPAMEALDEPLRSCLLASADADGPDGLADWNLGRDRAAAVVVAGAPVDSVDGSACADFYENDR